jgi:hypothetical protein
MKRFLLIMWQLPQYLVGWLILSVVLMMRMMIDYELFCGINDLDVDVFYLRKKISMLSGDLLLRIWCFCWLRRI